MGAGGYSCGDLIEIKLHSSGVAERQNEDSAGAAFRAERVISNLKGRFNRSDEVPLALPARLLERFFDDLERAHDCAERGPWRQDLCTAHSGSVPIDPVGLRRSCRLLAECRPEYLGDLGRGPVVLDASPSRSRVERRDAAVVLYGDFRTVINQMLDHAGPGPLHRAE